MAMSRVLSTIELLEAILLQADITTLLVSAISVSKNWNTVIAKSVKLQQHMFFRPVPPTKKGSREAQELNPLLIKLFIDANGVLVFNYHWPCVNWLSPKTYKTLKRKSVLTRRGASWRKMLVSQPPPVELAYFEARRNFSNTMFSRAIIKCPHGLTLGLVYDLMPAAVRYFVSPRFRFCFNWEADHRDHVHQGDSQTCEFRQHLYAAARNGENRFEKIQVSFLVTYYKRQRRASPYKQRQAERAADRSRCEDSPSQVQLDLSLCLWDRVGLMENAVVPALRDV